MENMTLVVLAAGMGSRFGGLKQIENVDDFGHIIIDYSLTDAIESGFNRVLFVIRREMKDDFLSLIGSRRWFGNICVELVFQEINSVYSPIRVLNERKKPWGTAHAIACLHEKIDSPFAVINADDFYGREAMKSIADGLKRGEECMVTYKLKNTVSKNGAVSRGVCNVENGYLKDIEEKSGIQIKNGKIVDREGRELFDDSPVSMNFWGFKPDIIEECIQGFRVFLADAVQKDAEVCEYYIPTVVSSLIKEKRRKIRVFNTDSTWHGITYKEDKNELLTILREMNERGIYPVEL